MHLKENQNMDLKYFKWINGRQNSGYKKILLATLCWPVAFDCYIIKYEIGSFIPNHKDPVSGKNHFRLNILLKKSSLGGDFVCEKTILNWSRLKLFRPDRYYHSVSKIVSGNRYVLSIGWLWGKNIQ